MKRSWFVIAAAIPLVAIASVVVWKASGDDSRRQAALGEGEAVALSWRGDWAAEADYSAGNVVSHEGASYVAEGEKLSTPKPDCSECGWTVMAAEGAAEDAKEATPTSGLSGYEIVGEFAPNVAAGALDTKITLCPLGKVVLGGGVGTILLQVEDSTPIGPGSGLTGGRYGWRGIARNTTSQSHPFLVTAVCANAS